MLTAQQELKKKIASVKNEKILENLKCFVMGMNAQKELDLKKTHEAREETNAHKEV